MRRIPTSRLNSGYKGDTGSEKSSIPDIILPRDLSKKLALIGPYIEKGDDIKVREIMISGDQRVKAACIFIEGTIDTQALHLGVLQPLMLGHWGEEPRVLPTSVQYYIDRIRRTSITVGQISSLNTLSQLIYSIYDGLAAILIDGFDEAIVLDIRTVAVRSPEEPPAERVLRGPRNGFVENLVLNLGLIRRQLRDPNLVVKKMTVGRRTRTDVAVVYINDIAHPSLVKKVLEKIQAIDIDGIAGISTIEQLIEERPFALFPQMMATERPGRVVAALLEGRLAIMSDCCPIALIVPNLFLSSLQAPDDYYERPVVGSFSRLLRFFGFFLTVSFPSLYIAVIGFQPELLPFSLLTPVAQGRSQVPFPAVLEALIMEVIIQLLVEAGVRLPLPLAQTIGVVGAIVLGQTAVQAHLASSALVVILAITAVANFTIPDYSVSLAIRLVRLLLLFLSAVFGLFGFSVGWLLIITHLADVDSMGVPYLSPIAPTRYRDLKDAFIRSFLWTFKKRPQSIPVQDETRMGPGQPAER